MEKPYSVIHHTVLICLRFKQACTCTKIDLFNLIFHIQFSCSFDWVRCHFMRKHSVWYHFMALTSFFPSELLYYGKTIYIFGIFSLRLLIPLGKAMPIVLHINFVWFWTKNSSKNFIFMNKIVHIFLWSSHGYSIISSIPFKYQRNTFGDKRHSNSKI